MKASIPDGIWIRIYNYLHGHPEDPDKGRETRDLKR